MCQCWEVISLETPVSWQSKLNQRERERGRTEALWILSKLLSPPWPDSCWDQLFSFQYGVLCFPEFPEDDDLGQIHASTFKHYWSVKRDLPLPRRVHLQSQGDCLFVTGEMALARCTHTQIQNLVVYLLSGGREICVHWNCTHRQLNSHLQATEPFSSFRSSVHCKKRKVFGYLL